MSTMTVKGPKTLLPSPPRVSVVLPTYNGSRYLRESIESVLNQTFTDLELIVVDDCSSDSTADIVRSFDDPRVHYVRNGVNCNLPRSLNRGFALAAGEYLTWTSDDNLYEPNAIELMVKALDKYPDTDVVCCHYKFLDESGAVTDTVTLPPTPCIVHWNSVRACFLYRRWLSEKLGGYDPDKRLVEDYDFWLRVARVGRIRTLNATLYYYRQHGSSLTGVEGAEKIKALSKSVAAEQTTVLQRLTYFVWAKLQANDGDRLSGIPFVNALRLRLRPFFRRRYIIEVEDL